MSQDSQGRYVKPAESFTAANVASAARTATGNGTAFDSKGIDSVSAVTEVTASAGTDPTCLISLETTADGTVYYAVGSFTSKTTTTAAESKVFGPLGTLSRWKWTIGGTDTPSFTFYVTSTVDRDN